MIMEPWARATIGQVKTGAAYLTVINHGAAGDRLLTVSTPVAAKAQFHSNIMDDGCDEDAPRRSHRYRGEGIDSFGAGRNST